MDRPIVELHRCANLLRESGAGGLEGREDVVGVFEVVVVTGFITIQGLRESNENEQRERGRRKIKETRDKRVRTQQREEGRKKLVNEKKKKT